MIEFQCLCFGPYTLQFSDWHFEYQNGNWKKVDGRDDLEAEIARSIGDWITLYKVN